MLSEGLPIYSAGLGNVAAISSKRPVIWACRWSEWGLLYQQGYFAR